MTTSLLAFILSLSIGTHGLSLIDYIQAALQHNSSHYFSLDTFSTIFLEIRLPRSLVAMFSGASLALAGALAQGIFRNSLASPSILGTNAGGVLAAILTFYFGSAWSNTFVLPTAAIFGSITSTLIVLWIFNKQHFRSIGSLLLLGFALNALLSGITSFTLSFLLNDYEKSVTAIRWILGSYASSTWTDVIIVFTTMVIGISISKRLANQIDIMSLGDSIARTLTVNPRNLKSFGIICLSILVGGSIAVAGGIPFVGLIVPHITRIYVGPSHKLLFFTSLINGASLTLICDMLARTIRFPDELEIGSLTTIIGAPFFIWLLLRDKKDRAGQLS